jgi:hypothetical protein
VRIREDWPPGLLHSVVGIDLVGLSEAAAQRRLRDEIAAAVRGRVKPSSVPPFPPALRAAPTEPRFPGALAKVFSVPGRNPHFTGRAAQLGAIRTGLAAADNPDTPLRTSKPWIRGVVEALAAVAALTTVILGVVDAVGWLRSPQRQCATVTAKPFSPVYLEIGQPPLKQKRYGEQVELYPALEPVNTPQGTYRAVRLRQGMDTYGWMLDSHLTDATCNPK